MSNNIVVAAFNQTRSVSTRRLYQYDYGQILRFQGLELPNAYTVHFANQALSGTAVKQIGGADGVSIPDALLLTGLSVYAWIFLHTGESDGETVYMATIPVQPRPRPTEEEPTPVQQGLIEQALAALNAAVEQTGEDAAAASQSADRAEQAANTAGYMEFEINQAGHLIYTKTPAVDVDFALVDGHLVMEVG